MMGVTRKSGFASYLTLFKYTVLSFIACCTLVNVAVARKTVFIPGQFSVSSTGAATYSIPIEVPPGTAGLAPKLSLEYNSQRGDGLLGIGWSLGGLSVITRCSQTQAQDGVRGRVSLDWNDRFCLDGQRLMAVSGSYGANGTEYRTERETFAKVISYGTAGNGPTWFKVWAKDGLILEFGNTTNSRIFQFAEDTPLAWALNRVSDIKSNYYTITYSQNTFGAYWPTVINYTGNSSTGLAPYNSVEFLYFNPRLGVPTYLPSPYTLSRLEVLLGGIRTKNGSNIVREYWMTIAPTNLGTSRARIAELQECGGGSSTYCLPKTTFEWQQPTEGPQNWTWSGGAGVGSGGWRLADLFGDGRKVYYTHNGSGTHYATRLNADGTLQNWTWTGGLSTANGGWAVGDLFGDGREVFYTHSSSGTHYATRLNSDGTLQNWTWTGGHAVSTSGWQLGDLFGEGRQLFYTHSTSGAHYATKLNADGTVQNWTWTGGHGVGNAGWRLANLFGDGRKLYYTITATVGTPTQSGSFTHNVSRLNQDGTIENFTHTTQSILYNAGWDVGDIFGDGREVFYMHAATGEHFAMRVNPNPGGNPSTLATENFGFGGFTSSTGDLGWTLVDLFGDGRKLYYTHWSNGQHYAVRLNTSNSWTWTGGHGVGDSGWTMGDLFGDGRQSYYTHSANGTHNVTRFASAAPDLIKKITTGLGATTEISYKPLTDTSGGFYTKDSGATYPTMDIQAPIQTVYQVKQSNGIGGFVTDTYSYTGAKTDLNGRGFLGFRVVSRYNDATQITQRAEYRQDWPYLGMPSLIVKSLPGVEINRATNTYAATGFGGTRYFPYLSQSVVQSWDLNGTTLPTLTTTSQVDSYGNPTLISATASDGYGKTTTNTFLNDTTNWFLGRLTRSVVTSTAP